MKKYEEIKKDLQKAREDRKAIEKEIDNIVDMKHELIKTYGIKNLNELIDRKEISEKLVSLNTEKQRKELEIKILCNNLEKAVINDILPVFVEVWNKYKGKRHGEKTAEKIRNEVQEKAGFYIYVTSDSVSISNGCEIRIECYTNNCKILLDNVIQEITIDTFFSYGGKYVENVSERIDKLLFAFQEVQNKMKEVELACKEFNNLTVGNIDNIYLSNMRSYI